MKKVVMLTLQAGPDGVREPNTTHTLPDEEAEQLVAGGFARYAESERAVPKTAETATAPHQRKAKPAVKKPTRRASKKPKGDADSDG